MRKNNFLSFTLFRGWGWSGSKVWKFTLFFSSETFPKSFCLFQCKWQPSEVTYPWCIASFSYWNKVEWMIFFSKMDHLRLDNTSDWTNINTYLGKTYSWNGLYSAQVPQPNTGIIWQSCQVLKLFLILNYNYAVKMLFVSFRWILLSFWLAYQMIPGSLLLPCAKTG